MTSDVIRRIDLEEYAARWRCTHDRVFSGRPIDALPFCDETWEMVLLLGGLLISATDLRALAAVAIDHGDGSAVLVDGEGEWAGEPPVILEWSSESFEDAHNNTVFGHTIGHVFGRSGLWGVATSPESFSVLGAERGFAEAFLQATGGREKLRCTFLDGASGIGFGEEGKDYVARLVRMVGWSQ